LHRNGLALEAPQEFLRFCLGTKALFVFCGKRIARESVRVGKEGIVGAGAAGLKRKAEEAFRFGNISGVDAAGGGGPGFGLFALEPAPE